MLTEFHFIRPLWLLALLPCVALIMFMLKRQSPYGNWAAVCDEALLPYIVRPAGTQKKGAFISTAMAAVLSIIALAGPTWQQLPVPVFRNDSGLVIALDLSRSMLANDIKPSRLIRARYKITDLLTQRQDGQTALIVYAGDAFVVSPLTSDHATITNQLNALTPHIIPSTGSNTSRALQEAQKLLKQAGLSTGHILLITDGLPLTKTLETLKQLSAYHVSVLAIGTQNGAPIRLPEGGFVKDQQGNIVVAQLNLAELQQVARAGNGIFQHMRDDDGDVKALLAAVDDSIKKNNSQQQKDLVFDQWDDKGPWLLLLVLPLLMMNGRRGILIIALLFILPLPKNSYAFDWQDLWETNHQKAQKLYQQQDYSGAAKTFNNPHWKAMAHYKAGEFDQALEVLKDEKTAHGFYNQGNALAQKGALQAALEKYNQALKLKPDDKDTHYNKKLVEQALEKQKKQQQQPSSDKEESKPEKSKGDQPSESSDQPSESSDQPSESSDQPSESSDQPSESSDQPSESGENKSKNSKPEKSKENKSKDLTSEKDASEQPHKKRSAKESQKEQHQKTKKEEEVQSPKIASENTEMDETQQALEQWLNRIPDDPAELLRRKFQYQYNLRQHADEDNTPAW